MTYDTWKTSPPYDPTPDYDGKSITLNISRDGAALHVDAVVGEDVATVLESEDSRWPVGSDIALTLSEQGEAAMEAAERYVSAAEAAAEDRADAARERAWEMDR